MKILHKVHGIWTKKAELEPPLVHADNNTITIAMRGGKYGDIHYRVVMTIDELKAINTVASQAQ